MTAFRDSTISATAEDRIRRELEDGEELLWADQPVAGAYARRAWPFAIFGFFFLAMVVGWEVMAIWMVQRVREGASAVADILAVVFPVMSLPFLIVGLFLFTATWRARRAARGVFYGITNRRAIIITSRLGSEEVSSITPDELGNVARRERRGDIGDVTFGGMLGLSKGAAFAGDIGVSRSRLPGFIGVRKAREVERMVRALAETGNA